MARGMPVACCCSLFQLMSHAWRLTWFGYLQHCRGPLQVGVSHHTHKPADEGNEIALQKQKEPLLSRPSRGHVTTPRVPLHKHSSCTAG